MTRPYFLVLLLIGLLLAACQTPSGSTTITTAAPAESQLVTPEPTATSSPSTETSLPSATAPPTDTPEPTPESTPTLPPAPVFTFYGADPSEPVIARRPSEALDGAYINPGAVLYHEGEFHMFMNSFTAWPGLVEIAYLTSPDGREWTLVQEEPVFTSEDIPFVRQGADVSTGYVAEDGTWVLYFHTVNSGGLSSVLGRITAPDPLGPWMADSQPMLEPGEQGAWDAAGLAWPSLVQTEDELVLYYAGTGRPEKKMIGRATSTDGINWTKYDDPATTDDPFATSDPVLQPAGEWDDDSIDRARVVRTEDGWVMIYQGGVLSNRALAFSADGITWEPYPANPVITAADFPLFGNTWDTALVFQDGVYHYFMEIGTLSGTNIYLATYEGNLTP